MRDRTKETSKFLSFVLRHQPEEIGLTLDDAGWASVEELLDGCKRAGRAMTREDLQHIVDTSDKKRFALSEDGLYIRANQGHSIEVELGYEPREPPAVLYHGTATRFLESIRQEGLKRGNRHHVHLSGDDVTAAKVGARHGRAVVLRIASSRMHNDGFLFYLSENGVWLTERVPPDYILVE
jgi:putative RNA 2'-phosphotransferase